MCRAAYDMSSRGLVAHLHGVDADAAAGSGARLQDAPARTVHDRWTNLGLQHDR
jgi:hypothetical protein